jgi:pimeloyl-ACP methyl ester carboxylesterase
LVTYDMRGQGASLLRSGLPLAPIQFKSQVRDLAALVRSLGRQPIHLVGLSYGASIGHAFMLEHADSVRSFFSVAAFLAPDPTQDAWIRFHVARVRGTPLHPMQPLSDEQLYDYFLRVLIYTTYPGAEPIILENPLKIEGVFRLVQGVRKFNVFDVMTDLPPQKIHYLWSAKDEYLDPALIGRFLRELPPDVPLSETIVREGEHKLPEQFPAFLAQWLGAVLTRAPLFKNGARWEAHPLDGVARSGARELYFEPETGYRRPGLNKSNLGWTEELSGWRFTHADPRKPLCKALF